ncbi:hypothetical protein VP01_430g1 [Puccinia sorghi]|uniref:Uncharacterized protein n=1 Tax=Puccinia sorghi TaxID=27349 RepID=A0A0L6UQY2_9BASI|nr:hypothetical protein VP01_430g1 [Puccinia sorghi]
MNCPIDRNNQKYEPSMFGGNFVNMHNHHNISPYKFLSLHQKVSTFEEPSRDKGLCEVEHIIREYILMIAQDIITNHNKYLVKKKNVKDTWLLKKYGVTWDKQFVFLLIFFDLVNSKNSSGEAVAVFFITYCLIIKLYSENDIALKSTNQQGLTKAYPCRLIYNQPISPQFLFLSYFSLVPKNIYIASISSVQVVIMMALAHTPPSSGNCNKLSLQTTSQDSLESTTPSQQITNTQNVSNNCASNESQPPNNRKRGTRAKLALALADPNNPYKGPKKRGKWPQKSAAKHICGLSLTAVGDSTKSMRSQEISMDLYVALIETLLLPSYKPVVTSTKLQARAFVMGLQMQRLKICIAHHENLHTLPPFLGWCLYLLRRQGQFPANIGVERKTVSKTSILVSIFLNPQSQTLPCYRSLHTATQKETLNVLPFDTNMIFSPPLLANVHKGLKRELPCNGGSTLSNPRLRLFRTQTVLHTSAQFPIRTALCWPATPTTALIPNHLPHYHHQNRLLTPLPCQKMKLIYNCCPRMPATSETMSLSSTEPLSYATCAQLPISMSVVSTIFSFCTSAVPTISRLPHHANSLSPSPRHAFDGNSLMPETQTAKFTLTYVAQGRVSTKIEASCRSHQFLPTPPHEETPP